MRAGKKNRQHEASTAGDHFTKACYDELVELMGGRRATRAARSPWRRRCSCWWGSRARARRATCRQTGAPLQERRDAYASAGGRRRAPPRRARAAQACWASRWACRSTTRDGDRRRRHLSPRGSEHARRARRSSAPCCSTPRGRLQIDDELMGELEEIARDDTKPEHTLLVCDSMMGREAVTRRARLCRAPEARRPHPHQARRRRARRRGAGHPRRNRGAGPLRH